jgi:signal transduction histidine kinase
MSNSKQETVEWQSKTFLSLRMTFLVGITFGLYMWCLQGDVPIADCYTDIAIAFGITFAATVAVGIVLFVSSLFEMLPIVIITGDLIIVGAYTYFTDADPVFLIGVAGFLMITEILYLGSKWGRLGSVGVILAALAMGMYVGQASDNSIDFDITKEYSTSVVMMILLALSGSVWFGAQSKRRSARETDIDDVIKSGKEQMEEMRKRIRAIAEMIESLGGTLNLKEVLNAVLDIGEFSVGKRNGHEIVCLVLLFRANDGKLYVANSRGLSASETRMTFKGQTGIMGKALEECVPIIGKNAANDPELGQIAGFENMKSMLCMPLHAHYDNFGALVYGSTKAGAFKEDTIDILKAIGMQATVALHNAVLYNNLMEEKDRIIQLEEDARKDLVRDLHDIPTQTISAVAMRLRIIMRLMENNVDEVPSELEIVEGMALRATEEMRHVLFKLRPLVLESKGLSAALDQLADRLQKTYSQACTVKIDPDVEKYMDVADQGALFYLVEEAANNARKYAEAKTISIQAAKQGDTIMVRIADNGVGFDSASVDANYDERGSFGMVNMRERAELLDGTLTLKSVQGKGTAITVVIPINSKAQSTETGTYAQVSETKLSTSNED